MSKYSYAGDFVNPVSSMRCSLEPNADGKWFVECLRRESKTDENGHVWKTEYWSPHTSGHLFDESDDVHEYLDNLEETFEQDYDDYLEENRYEIVQMERYEMWRKTNIKRKHQARLEQSRRVC